MKDLPPGARYRRLPPQDGFLFLDKAEFHATFAADVDPKKAASWRTPKCRGVRLLAGNLANQRGEQASWYLIATEDKAIPPDAQRANVQTGGAPRWSRQGPATPVYVSHPIAVLR